MDNNNTEPLVFFKPWIGCQYNNGGIFGRRIMVLGESHYCGENCKECGLTPDSYCSEFTSRVVNDYLNQNNEREGWMSTYLKFERSLVNHITTPIESETIWNSILFYNYLQVAMQEPRQTGSTIQFKAAEAAFFNVLDQNQPDLLIVWGKRLWNKLPYDRWTNGDKFKVDGYDIDNGYYSLSNGKMVRTICVYHPSVGYSWDYWYRVIMENKD